MACTSTTTPYYKTTLPLGFYFTKTRVKHHKNQTIYNVIDVLDHEEYDESPDKGLGIVLVLDNNNNGDEITNILLPNHFDVDIKGEEEFTGVYANQKSRFSIVKKWQFAHDETTCARASNHLAGRMLFQDSRFPEQLYTLEKSYASSPCCYLLEQTTNGSRIPVVLRFPRPFLFRRPFTPPEAWFCPYDKNYDEGTHSPTCTVFSFAQFTSGMPFVHIKASTTLVWEDDKDDGESDKRIVFHVLCTSMVQYYYLSVEKDNLMACFHEFYNWPVGSIYDICVLEKKSITAEQLEDFSTTLPTIDCRYSF